MIESQGQLERWLTITETNTLELKNPDLRSDSCRLEFDVENHEYHVHSDHYLFRIKASASQIVKHFFPAPDFDKICRRMVGKPGFRKSSKYKNEFLPSILEAGLGRDMDDEELVTYILDRWRTIGKFAAHKGTLLHKYAELLCNGIVSPDFERPPEYNYVNQYLETKSTQGWKPFRTEWRIFNLANKTMDAIAGTIDLVMYRDVSEHREYCIVDWKRCIKIERKNMYSRAYGKSPCHRFPDCNYSHYSLQLLIYKYILKQSYRLEICGGMYLVIIHPNYNMFEEIEIEHQDESIIESMLGQMKADTS